MKNIPLPLLATLTACCLSAPASASLQEAEEATGPPNVIVILADDLGAEGLGCYGGESYVTPNLDAMAAEGWLCENAFSQPLCTPTRVELLTGRSNARNYRAFSVLDPEERTFAHVLRNGGYRTMAVGKWQLYGANHIETYSIRSSGSLPDEAGFERHTLWQVKDLGSRYWEPSLSFDGILRKLDKEAYGPDVVLESALEWIDEGEDGQPFLLFWPMMLPHRPFLAPPGVAGPHAPPENKQAFVSMVHHLDSLVGRLRTHLEERDLVKNTWVLFIGDNGTPQRITSKRKGVDVVGGKKLPNDAGSRVPFLVWAPGRLPAGGRITEPVGTIDVFNTVIELAGLELPTDRPLDGRSLLPRLRGERERHRDAVAFHYQPRPVTEPEQLAQRWARDERFQLFEDGRMFDTSVDPLLERPLDPSQKTVEVVGARERLSQALSALPQAGEDSRKELATPPKEASSADDPTRAPEENDPQSAPATTGEVATPLTEESLSDSQQEQGLEGTGPRKNVLFILVDDLGFMDIEPNNPETFYETPNISKLAAQGMRFTQGYAASPVCSPTRYSIQTGKHPTRVNATDYFTGRRQQTFAPAELRDEMPLDEFTIAQALKEEGYATFFAGKWHLGKTEAHWPEQRGYDHNYGGHERGGPYGPGKYFSPYGNPRLEDGPPGEHLPERLSRETATFIRENAERPFFAFLSFYSVHTPLLGRPDLVAKYQTKAERLRLHLKNAFGTEEQHWEVSQERRLRVLQSHPTYAAMIESMDEAVGVVLDALDQAGVADNTCVVFFSDNGGLATSEGLPTSNLPLRAGKGWLYEGGIREPMIVRLPGVTTPDSVCEDPVVSMDFYPTILEVTGSDLRPEQHLDGRSLLPLLRGDPLPPRSMIWHYPHYSNQGGFPGAAIRVGEWKLFEEFEEGERRLVHLGRDPGELNDVAIANPDIVEAMSEELHAWYDEVDANFLRPLPGGPQPWRPVPKAGKQAEKQD